MALERQSSVATALCAALVLVFAVLCTRFVWQPTLTSLADDSVSYLVMAQTLSPWHPAAPPVAEAFAREAFYPPLFPALLALAGGAHDIALAHGLTALILAACLVALYALAGRWLGSNWAAAAVVATTALLPAVWIHAKAILSEPLFCLLLLLTLRVIDAPGRTKSWMLWLLLAALALTRTVGLIVAAGYALWALTRRSEPLAGRLRALLPVLAAGAAYALWVWLRPAETSDDYMRIVAERVHAMLVAQDPWTALAASLARQAKAMAEAWFGALLLFWVEGEPLRVILAGTVGALALAGITLRFVAGRADAWMIGAYLATFLVWPFYDQMTRFLFPVLPLLMLYAFCAVHAGMLALRRPLLVGHALLALLVVSLVVPGLGFIRQRANMEGRFVEIIDWYRTPDLAEARERASIHLDLMADMEAIRRLTRPEDRIAWVGPSYIALLAQRRGIAAPPDTVEPDEYRRAVHAAGADYVFLSAYHPRDTIRDSAWRAGTQAMIGHGEIVHSRTRAGGAAVSSVLLKVKQPSPSLVTARAASGP